MKATFGIYFFWRKTVSARLRPTHSESGLPQFLREGILQGDGAVEDRGAGLRVLGVGAEVADAFELDAVTGRGFQQLGFDVAGDGLERVRVEVGAPVEAV